MLAGELYQADDPEIQADAARSAKISERFNASPSDDPEARRTLLVELLGSVGEDVDVRPPLRVDYGTYITIGRGTFVNFGAVFLDVAPITIGEDVQFGPHVQLLTPTHPVDPVARRAKWEAAEPITIGDYVRLRGGVILTPRVTLGEFPGLRAGGV
ncbi:sugar O-acetyltransferase, partial [Streptomyces albidoflavus]